MAKLIVGQDGTSELLQKALIELIANAAMKQSQFRILALHLGTPGYL